MKKIKPVIALTIAAVTIITAGCKKDQYSTITPDSGVTKKVNGWLDNQKATNKKNKNNNIETLKQYLNYSQAQNFDVGEEKKLMVIPIEKDFQQEKHYQEGSNMNLLLILDGSGNIVKGNLVVSPAGTSAKAYKNIVSHQLPGCDGKFVFLSVSGRWLNQVEIKDGKLFSSGIIAPKNNATATQTASRTNMCIDWYLVTTFYVNGVPMWQDEEYVGTTCSGDCDDPNMQAICPDDGGGGGTGGMDDYVYESDLVCSGNWFVYIAANNQWYVKSYEELRGKWPTGGNKYFTNITHLNSSIFCMNSSPLDPTKPYATWQELASIVNVQSGSAAKSDISGKTTLYNGSDVPIHEFHIFNASTDLY